MKTYLIHFQIPEGNVQFSKYITAKSKKHAKEIAKKNSDYQNHILIISPHA